MSQRELAIGIDFGGTSVKFGVCDGAEIIATAEPIDTLAYYDRGPDALIEAITAHVNALQQSHPQVCAVGAGVPGLVDFERGHIFEITNVPGWVEIPFRDRLTAATGLPATVDNDANCMAFAESRLGAGQGYSNLIAITLGTGVGGGLIIGGQLHRGAQFCAGEIGETSIDYNRPLDDRGMPGVIEKFVGNREIASHARNLYEAAGIRKTETECTPKALAEAGDEIASQVWHDVANWLGVALGNVVWLLNPEAIVIGGGVANAGAVLFDPLRRRLDEVLSPVLAKNIQLIPARFGSEAGIVGAAYQAIRAGRPTSIAVRPVPDFDAANLASWEAKLGPRPDQRPDRQVPIMVASIERQDVTEIQLEIIEHWRSVIPVEFDGETFWAAAVGYRTQSMFGELQTEAHALMLDGEVVRWVYSGSGEPVP